MFCDSLAVWLDGSKRWVSMVSMLALVNQAQVIAHIMYWQKMTLLSSDLPQSAPYWLHDPMLAPRCFDDFRVNSRVFVCNAPVTI